MQIDGIPDVGDQPCQPRRASFPKVSFGEKAPKSRSFQAAWFDNWPWLHWHDSVEKVFCHFCVKAAKSGKLKCKTAEQAFIYRGVQNWNDATRLFRSHAKSDCHREAVESLITLPATTKHVGELLRTQLVEDRKRNRASLLRILRALRFLARQGIALRGSALTKEIDSNLSQLLRLFCELSTDLSDWLQKKTNKYTSADIQNELLKVMSLRILRDVSAKLEGTPYTIMVDETTDASTQEQVVIVLRWVDEDLEPHEDFIGLHITASTDAKSIVAIIRDVLVRMNLSLTNCRGQCYDGAAVMKGCLSGVAAQLTQDEPRALFTHCYGHSLNLACQDTIKDIIPIKYALDTTFELSKLLKYSAKRKSEYKRLQAEMAPQDPGFRTLCPTRWTVRAASLQSVMQNFSVIQSSLDSFADTAKRDPEMSARCTGVAAQFSSFDFLFGVALGEKVLKLVDNLSKALQHKMSAAQGQVLAELTIKSLALMRTEAEFSNFCEKLIEKQSKEDVAEPSLPRKRKRPCRYDEGSSGHFATCIEDHYRVMYFSAFDMAIQSIKSRFDQPHYKIYSKLECTLLKGAAGESYTDDLSSIQELYCTDFDSNILQTQLLILYSHFRETAVTPALMDVVDYVKSLGKPGQLLLSEVVKLIRLILVAPATNATSERTFSALRIVKTYLRCTMTQARLNHLLMLHVHKEACDSLDLELCIDDFCRESEHRRNIFGSM